MPSVRTAGGAGEGRAQRAGYAGRRSLTRAASGAIPPGSSMAAGVTDSRLMPAGATYVAPLVLFMLLAFNLPIVLMLGWSIGAPPDFLAHYAQVFERPVYLKVLGNTFRIALIATLVCALLGYPLAYWMRGLPPGRQLVALALVVLPFWVSILVRTYAWIVILGNDGVVNRTLQAAGLAQAPVSFLYNEFGVIFGTANVLLPFLVLPLLQAAASLGASRRAIFWRVFFPLTLPSLAAGAILVFILTLGFFITPAILGGGRVPMIANMLDLLINRLPRWELAAAISTVLLALTLACYGAYRRVGAQSQA
jgi:putative spermidine/putrescine transport system permease protein